MNDAKPNLDADNAIKQCQERLKTDTNYKKQDYDLDMIRMTILKLPPLGNKSQSDAMTHVSFNGDSLNLVLSPFPFDD